MDAMRIIVALTFCIYSANAGCEDGWLSFRDSCYLYVKELETWLRAQQECKSLGGHLVDIADAEENEFVHSNLINYWNWHHIGLTDRINEGTFKWVTGKTLEYNNFWPGEPNNSGGKEDCGEMRYSGLWNDVSCYKEQYFICEKELADPDCEE